MSNDHLQPETLGALVDGELSPVEHAAVQAHLDRCPDCSKRALGLHQLRSATRQAAFCNLPTPQVMARLTARIHPVKAQPSPFARYRAFLLQVAAVLLLAATALSGWRWMRQSDSLATEVLDQHLAALSQSSQPEVISSDRHTVKPWFEGKLPFSFNLPEPYALPADTVLNGADLVYIDGRPTALLLFTIHKHHTSVFVSQAGPFNEVLRRPSRSGFQFVQAKAAGLEFLGVSDANVTELDALVRSLTAVQ